MVKRSWPFFTSSPTLANSPMILPWYGVKTWVEHLLVEVDAADGRLLDRKLALSGSLDFHVFELRLG